MIHSFEAFSLDTDRLELRRDGEPVAVEPQVFDVLAHLIEHRDRVVSKEELLDEVWGDRFVSESTLTSRIAAARHALDDDGRSQRIIRTAHGRGYRFVAEVATRESGTVEEPVTVGVRSEPAGTGAELIGRDHDLEELAAHLDRSRLVTITGPGGVGKTSLAWAVGRHASADRHPDGVWFVELVAVAPDAMADTVATALDVQARSGLSSADALAEVLATRQGLLVLDNCEHVVAGVSELVARLLASCPRLQILATSRESLRVAGEQVYPVATLPWRADDADRLPPAVRLFEARARAVDPAFVVDDTNLVAIGEICARLDGVPLAIELAAARTRVLDPADLVGRLDERFRILTGGTREGDPRHRALLDTIGWSYELLTPVERRMFCQLSVFAGRFTLDAAEAVCDVDGDVLDLLTGLVDRCMLTVRRGQGSTRFEVLESLRAFGSEHLDDAERDAIRRRHRDHYVALAGRAAEELDGPREGAFLRDLDHAFDNLRAAHVHALEHHDAEAALGLVVGIGEYAMRAMRYEVMGWAAASVGIAELDHPLHPAALGLAAYGSFVRGDFDRAVAEAGRVRALETDARREPCGMAERVLANCHSLGRDFDGLIRECERQIEVAGATGRPGRLAHAAYMGSAGYASAGRMEEAEAAAATAMRAARESGSPTAEAGAEYAAAFAAAQDRPGVARRHAVRAHELAASVGNRWMSAFARGLVGSIDLLGGELDSARVVLADVVDIWYRSGDWSQTWLTLGQSFVALDRAGRAVDAARVIGAIEAGVAIGAAPCTPAEQAAMFESVEHVRDAMGTLDYDRVRAEGAASSLGEVVQHTRVALTARSGD